jgi:dihydroneopterin aldolase
VTDSIEISGIRVFGRHGANAGEKEIAQPFDVDVWLDVDLSTPRRSDALADTLDYAALHATIVSIVGERSYDLLERLGAALLDVLLADARVELAAVRIAKPALLAGATPSVTVRGERAR